MQNREIFTEGYQIGRYVEVEIRNYLTGEKISIPNDFHIEFTFFKTIDEANNSSTGSIKIYGLKLETIKRMQSESGEVRLSCGYVNSDVSLLFVADILRLYPTIENNVYVANIECSANLQDYYASRSPFSTNGEITPIEAIRMFSSQNGIKESTIFLDNVDIQYHKAIQEYLSTAAIRLAFVGTAHEKLFWLCRSFGMTPRLEYTLEGRNLELTFDAAGLNQLFSQINQGYNKAKISASAKKDVESVFITQPEQYRKAYLLNKNTGLLNVQEEYKIATAYENQGLHGNEEQTKKSELVIQKSNEKRAKQLKKKPDKKFKIRTIKVNRKYAKVTALLNPYVKPQGHIVVESSVEQYSSLYRVRNATYKGNNKSGSWTMELYCEDNSKASDKPLTKKQEESQKVNGEQGEEYEQ